MCSALRKGCQLCLKRTHQNESPGQNWPGPGPLPCSVILPEALWDQWQSRRYGAPAGCWPTINTPTEVPPESRYRTATSSMASAQKQSNQLTRTHILATQAFHVIPPLGKPFRVFFYLNVIMSKPQKSIDVASGVLTLLSLVNSVPPSSL